MYKILIIVASPTDSAIHTQELEFKGYSEAEGAFKSICDHKGELYSRTSEHSRIKEVIKLY